MHISVFMTLMCTCTPRQLLVYGSRLVGWVCGGVGGWGWGGAEGAAEGAKCGGEQASIFGIKKNHSLCGPK